jgi:hypothetical protein
MIVLILRWRKKRILKLKEAKYKEKMKMKLLMIEERKEIEEFIENFSDYANALGLSESENEEFLEYVKSIQFKRSWSDEESQRVKLYFDKLKGQLQ